jgi:putative ATPase
MDTTPLSEIMRPTRLDSFVGGEKFLSDSSLIGKMRSRGVLSHLIFYGPPGCGKTTLALLLAKEFQTECISLSAVSSGVAEVRKAVETAQTNKRLGITTVLFIDEIHRFSKTQQDALLLHVEKRDFVLLGATTEHPSFSIIPALLSRAHILELSGLKEEDLLVILNKALIKLTGKENSLEEEEKIFLIHLAGGDARYLLGNLEILSSSLLSGEKPSLEEMKEILLQKPGTNKRGSSEHFNLASAFIKSMRGGDVTATLYYLARFLDSAEDPLFIARRMCVFASEDIGIANASALILATSCLDSVARIGMPESRYILFHTALYLTESKKSRRATSLMHHLEKIAKETSHLEPPLHIRNASTSHMKESGYGEGVLWEAGFVHPKGFLPKEVEKKCLDNEEYQKIVKK